MNIKKPPQITNIDKYIENWKSVRKELWDALEKIPDDIFLKSQKKVGLPPKLLNIYT
jgi:hypothetical protein